MFGKTGITALLALCLLSASAFAMAEEEEGRSARLPVPRFVTLATDEINLRTGPGMRYPIRIVLKRDGLPVEVVREFDVWRQIRDIDGDEGWVHKTMLSGRRAVIVKGGMQTLVRKPDDMRPVVRLEPGVVAGLEKCKKEWCELSVAGYDGWLKRTDIWGVYPNEKIGED